MRFAQRPSDAPCVNPGAAVKALHDSLLANQPAGAVHEPCELCPDPALNKEVAQVAGDRTYTEAEHVALMADAVTRETASLTESKTGLETTVSEQVARIDTLEAEKAALETKVAQKQTEFDDYKAEVERAHEVETAKTTRVEAVKAAVEALPEAYFTDERVQRWAEMTEEAFAVVVEDLKTAFADAQVKPKETAAFRGGHSPSETDKPSLGGYFAAFRGGN